MIEPGGFSTDWAGSSSKRVDALPDYDEVHAEAERVRSQRVVQAGRSESVGGSACSRSSTPTEPPLRVFFGDAPLQTGQGRLREPATTWEQWQPVAELAQG